MPNISYYKSYSFCNENRIYATKIKTNYQSFMYANRYRRDGIRKRSSISNMNYIVLT
jgi:hypothetical protein